MTSRTLAGALTVGLIAIAHDSAELLLIQLGGGSYSCAAARAETTRYSDTELASLPYGLVDEAMNLAG